MKTLLLILMPLVAFTQVDTAGICTGSAGQGIFHDLDHHTLWANFIVIDSGVTVNGCDLYATRYFVGEAEITDTKFNIINCEAQATACEDHYIPGIAVLKDSCIRDDEWPGNVLTDSVAFFTLDALMLFQNYGCYANDDCGIDSFFVKSLVITPPGGVSRPPGSTRRFDVTFRAVDFAGRSTEAVMTWVRNEDPNCLLD